MTAQPTDAAIDLADVSVLRGGRWILDGLTASFPVGACGAVLGPNGCGKSTLLRVLAGYVWPARGHVRVLGETFGATDLSALRRRVRLVQANGVVDPAPEALATDVVLTGFFGTAGLYDPVTDAMRDAASRELSRIGLARVAGQAFATLSSGERMRCLIARALVVRPSLLLLDEPTAGLDLVGREQVLGAIATLHGADASLTLLLTTHHLEELPTSTTHALLLSNGRRVAHGTPDRVLRDDVLSATYGCDVRVIRADGRFFATASPGQM